MRSRLTIIDYGLCIIRNFGIKIFKIFFRGNAGQGYRGAFSGAQ